MTTIVHARRDTAPDAAVLNPFVLVSTALVSLDYGEYQTIGSLIGYSSYHPLSTSHMQKGTLTVDEWLREVLDGKLPPAPRTARSIRWTYPTQPPDSARVPRPSTCRQPP